MAKCYTTRDQFVAAVGTINATISFPRTGIRYETKYLLIADRIEQMARRMGAHVLHTVTDDGLHVVTVKGFKQ